MLQTGCVSGRVHENNDINSGWTFRWVLQPWEHMLHELNTAMSSQYSYIFPRPQPPRQHTDSATRKSLQLSLQSRLVFVGMFLLYFSF